MLLERIKANLYMPESVRMCLVRKWSCLHASCCIQL